MSRGALLFAFNTDTVDYFSMAVYTAKRINHFLNLPVTVITDNIDNGLNTDYQFDNIIYTSSDHTNFKDNKVWLNKGRYQAFEDSPYDETLLLDTDYIVNSDRLLSLFSFYDDFCCHNSTNYILNPNEAQETIGKHGFNSLWATVILFKKTERVQQIFECMKMIQDNYDHYVKLYGMYKTMYRNDYSLGIAHHIVNGHVDVVSDYIPWDLHHVGKNILVKKNTYELFNTSYDISYKLDEPDNQKNEYIIVKDFDFHMLDKDNFMEIMAQNTKSVNYVKCANVLSDSILRVMPDANVTIITDKMLPYGDLAPKSIWKLINDWQVYEASPYEHTIKLEADMIIPSNIDYWWDILTLRDVVVCNTIRNFKGNISDIKFYRKFIYDNELPDVYNAITYFKKSEFAKDFFDTVRTIFENWEECKKILKCNVDEPATTDWVYALACHIHGVENTTIPAFTDMSMVHMKQHINDLSTEDWTNELVCEILPHCLRVNTFAQSYPFHYHVKKFSSIIEKSYG